MTIKQENNQVLLFTPLPMDTQWISAFFHHGTYFYYHVSRAELQYFLASKNPEFLRKKRQQSNIKQILYQKKRNCIAWNLQANPLEVLSLVLLPRALWSQVSGFLSK